LIHHQKYILTYDQIQLRLYDKQRRIDSKWDNEPITAIDWCSYLQQFLLLSPSSIFALNVKAPPYKTYKIDQIQVTVDKPMKYFANYRDHLIINYGLGAFIEHWTLRKLQLIKRWTKCDLFENENDVEINRIGLCTYEIMALNVDLYDGGSLMDVLSVIELINIETMTKLKRIPSSLFVLHVSPTQWLIKHKDVDNAQYSLCLLDSDWEMKQLDIKQQEDIDQIRFYGKHTMLLSRKTVNDTVKMEMYKTQF